MYSYLLSIVYRVQFTILDAVPRYKKSNLMYKSCQSGLQLRTFTLMSYIICRLRAIYLLFCLLLITKNTIPITVRKMAAITIPVAVMPQIQAAGPFLPVLLGTVESIVLRGLAEKLALWCELAERLMLRGFAKTLVLHGPIDWFVLWGLTVLRFALWWLMEWLGLILVLCGLLLVSSWGLVLRGLIEWLNGMLLSGLILWWRLVLRGLVV